jgi:hypothetical protein
MPGGADRRIAPRWIRARPCEPDGPVGRRFGFPREDGRGFSLRSEGVDVKKI